MVVTRACNLPKAKQIEAKKTYVSLVVNLSNHLLLKCQKVLLGNEESSLNY